MLSTSETLLSIKSKITSQSNNIYKLGILGLLLVLVINNLYFLILLIPYTIYLIFKVNKILVLVFGCIFSIFLLIPQLKQIPQSIAGDYRIIKSEKLSYNTNYVIRYKSIFLTFNTKTIYQVGDIIHIEGVVESYNKSTMPRGFDYQAYNRGNNIYGLINVTKLSYIRSTPDISKTINKMINFHQEPLRGLLESFFFGGSQSMLMSYLILSSLVINFIFKLVRKLCFIFNGGYLVNEVVDIVLLILISLFRIHNFIIIRLLILHSLYFINRLLKLNLSKQGLSLLSFILVICVMGECIYNFQFLSLFSFNALYYLLYVPHKKPLINKLFISIFSFIIFNIFNLSHYNNINIMEFFGYLLYSFILLKPMVIIVIIGFFMPFTDYLIAPLINLLNSLSKALSNIGSTLYLPQMGGIFTVLLIIGIITIFILSKKKRVMSLIGIMGILFICFLYHPLSNGIYFLDVGQGDSCVIIKDNHAMVIDAYNQTFNFLMSNNVRNIDYLVLSHNDNDHIGDAPKIIKYLHPSQIVMARNLDYQLSGPSMNASDGDCFVFQEIEILIISSLKNNKSPNNNSLCLKFNYLNYELLFVGDIESEVEIELVSRYAHSLDSDILKVAHHGSKTSSTQSFIQMVSPTYAIISLKKNNMYGFPHIETIKTLTSSRALIYTTSTSGTIAFLKNNKIITYPPKD